MPIAAQATLHQLLAASDATVRDAAWDELISRHTRLLLAVARSFGGGHDEAMDRYAYILEKLVESDFRRLRTFDASAGASFPTWLTITTKRLCLDHHRSLYGRRRSPAVEDNADPLRSLRRRLKDSLSSEIEPDTLLDSNSVAGDTRAVIEERNRALRSALMQLAPRDRLLLTLRFEDDLSASRIGQILGMPTPFNVYRRLQVVLRQLRDALEAQGIDTVDD
jgi:RNA polymerase sigma factor (sigma-70 family)